MRRTDGPWPVWEIIPGKLYQRGKLQGMTVGRKLTGLLYYGITEIVQLAPPQPDPDLTEWDNDGMFNYVHHPIPDGRLKGSTSLLKLADIYVDQIEDGGTVLTMCNAGRNRSGLMSALILMKLNEWDGVFAMNHVRLHRPRAIANPIFEEYLRDQT